VLEVEDWILPDLDRYNVAMEQTLQEILERLSAGQQEMKEMEEMEARAEARQGRADARQ
jgi:hypothetical protein